MDKIQYDVWVFNTNNHQCDRYVTKSVAVGKALARMVMRTVRRRMENPKTAWMFKGKGWRADRVVITTNGKKVGSLVPIVTVAVVALKSAQVKL
jgi:hypothetical protein